MADIVFRLWKVNHSKDEAHDRQTVLITSALAGIGRAAALDFARHS